MAYLCCLKYEKYSDKKANVEKKTITLSPIDDYLSKN